MKHSAEEGIRQGLDFLGENARRDGVEVMESGLQYRVIRDGRRDGKRPRLLDRVRVHYRGRLIDGTEFESSYVSNEPVWLPVSGVIEGWSEALQLMREGALWELTIPSQLAYGQQGAGGDIGPDATLIFEVELLKVE